MQVPALRMSSIGSTAARRLALGQEALEAVGDDRVLQAPLGAEVVIQRRRLHARPLGDRPGRDLRALRGVEQLGGGRQQAIAGVRRWQGVDQAVAQREGLGQVGLAAGEVADQVDVDIEAIRRRRRSRAGDRRRLRVLGDDALAPAANRVAPDVGLALVDRAPSSAKQPASASKSCSSAARR